MSSGVTILADFPCPHCLAQIEVNVYFSDVNIPTRFDCPACRDAVWIQLTEVEPETGQAGYRVGRPVGVVEDVEITTTKDGDTRIIPAGPPAVMEPGTFRAWLKDQPDNVQDQILGDEQGERFRAGENVDLDAFNTPKPDASINEAMWQRCPHCLGTGRMPIMKPGEQVDPRLRTYRLTDDLGIKRQGRKLSASAAAILIQKMSESSACPFAHTDRTDREDGSIEIVLYWDDPEVAEKGFKVGDTLIPEVK